MKVLFIQDHLRCGGTEGQTIHLLKGLKQKGLDVALITFRPGGALADSVLQESLYWTVLQRVDTRLNWWAPGLIDRVAALSPQAVILMGREANSMGFRLKKAFPETRIIGTLRTGRTLPFRYQKSLSHCDCVVANSEWAHYKTQALSHSIAQRTIVIKNGCIQNFDFEQYESLRKRMRNRMATEDGTTVFLMVAAFRAGKNHKDLLKIFGDLEGDWELWLVGSGPQKQKFLKSLNNSRIRIKVHDLGQIFELSTAYFGADIAVLPSLEESLPNFLIESQTCELPVVAYDTAGVKETFLDGESGFLIRQHDVDQFRQKIELLQQDSDLRREFGRKARKWALDEFDADRKLDDYLKVLQNSSI